MIRNRLPTAALALSLVACAMIQGGDPGIYARLNDQDVQIAARLMQQTLEHAPDGTTRRWTNDATGHGGAVTPVRTYVTEDGHFCRDYREEIAAAGTEGRFLHTACRTDDAAWVWL